MKFVYAGNEFYDQSGTMMGSIYISTGKGLKRSDWGQIQFAVQKGK